ncbi:MAG: protein translocase subunit SecF, partial [Mycobacterium sp.]
MTSKAHTAGDADEDATESPEAVDTAAGLPRHGFFSRLYTGTGAFEVIGRRRMWYAASGAMV